MKLLMVSANLPRPAWGASTRNYHLLKALARQNTVSLLALTDSAEVEAFSDMYLLEDIAPTVRTVTGSFLHTKRWQQLMSIARGKSYILTKFILKEMQDALDTMLAHDHYDAVLFESSLTAGYRLPAGTRIIIDQHNIEYELLKRTYEQEKAPLRKWYNWQESRLLKQDEIERCRKADVVLVTSERERLVLKGLLPENVIEVVPNGVDIETFYAHGSEREVPNQVIFTGTMDYYPNIHGVLFFAQQCWPLIRAQVPTATWQIVGRNPPPEVHRLAELPGVTITGTVPDVRPYLAASTVAIVPLQIGSGTRLKILEALAMQKAVVSTSIGCEGLEIVPGKHLLVSDQAEAFAQDVIAFMHNSEMRTTFGTAGRALVEAEYSWERCGNRLSHILEERLLVC
jgi:polysaccharide biosynthesis protein PslH